MISWFFRLWSTICQPRVACDYDDDYGYDCFHDYGYAGVDGSFTSTIGAAALLPLRSITLIGFWGSEKLSPHPPLYEPNSAPSSFVQKD